MRLRSMMLVGMVVGIAGLGVEVIKACCCVAPSDTPVRFTHQINLIVWDSANKIEHFVRNASFATSADELAFIAPTPAVPDIQKVAPDTFTVLEANRNLIEHPPQPQRDAPLGKALVMSAAPPVQVVQEVDVAGYHAVTLKADDSAALAKWLNENNFPLTPAVQDWCRAYIDKGWYLTTFKVQANHSVAETGLVRLTFKADQPFNPYYVPKTNQPEQNERQGLDLYFVSDTPYTGKLGNKVDWIGPHIAFQMNSSDLKDRVGFGQGVLPAKATVTYFNDPTFPREDADDIFFSPNLSVPLTMAAAPSDVGAPQPIQSAFASTAPVMSTSAVPMWLTALGSVVVLLTAGWMFRRAARR